MKNENDDFLEAEIIDKGVKKTKKKVENFDKEFEVEFSDMEDMAKNIKRTILLKGLTSLILPILVFVGILALIVFLIMILFDHPFDYILSALFIFVVLKPIYKLIKIIK